MNTPQIHNYQLCDILHSIILHLPVHHESLDLRQEVFTFFAEQCLVNFPFIISDRVDIHGWVMSVANEYDAFLEI
jgi:hypothetical protein